MCVFLFGAESKKFYFNRFKKKKINESYREAIRSNLTSTSQP